MSKTTTTELNSHLESKQSSFQDSGNNNCLPRAEEGGKSINPFNYTLFLQLREIKKHYYAHMSPNIRELIDQAIMEIKCF